MRLPTKQFNSKQLTTNRHLESTFVFSEPCCTPPVVCIVSFFCLKIKQVLLSNMFEYLFFPNLSCLYLNLVFQLYSCFIYIDIKLTFCLYIGPNHATFWLHTFQTKLWTKTPLTKFLPVCLSVCFRGFREKSLTIHLKTASGIVMKFHISIRYLLTYVFNYITFWYLDPKMGFGGAHKWKLSNNS